MQLKWSRASILVTLGGAIMVVGTILPWASYSASAMGYNIGGSGNGFNSAIGILLLALAIAIAGLGVAIASGRWAPARKVAVAVAAVAAVLAVVQLMALQNDLNTVNRFSSQVGGFGSAGGSLGIGIFVVVGGAIVAVVGGVLGPTWASAAAVSRGTAPSSSPATLDPAVAAHLTPQQLAEQEAAWGRYQAEYAEYQQKLEEWQSSTGQ